MAWGKMLAGRCCASARLEVRGWRGLVRLQLSPLFLPALPPGLSTVCSLTSPPGPPLELTVSTVRAPGRRKGRASWPDQAAGENKREGS